MKAGQPLPDLDRDIYDLLAACADARIPFSFCGNDPTRKVELMATLRKLLRKHGVDPAKALGRRIAFTVTADHA